MAAATSLESRSEHGSPVLSLPEDPLVSWRDGAEGFASDQYAVAMGSHLLRHQLMGDTVATPADTLEHPTGPWDEAGYMASPGFEAVKGPWLLRVSALGHRGAALALLARAVTAISAKQ